MRRLWNALARINPRSWVDAGDRAAMLLVAFIFLTYTVSGSAWYFSDGRFPPIMLTILAVYVPWALAAAVDVLGFLIGRRLHAALHSYLQSARGTPERIRARRSLWLNGGLLAGVALFTAYNGIQFLYESGWRPGENPFALAGAGPYILRALAGPLGFIAATLLTPVQQSLSARIRTDVHAVAHFTLGLVRNQWRERLRQLDSDGVDLTPLLVDLCEDAQERTILQTLYRGMHPEMGSPSRDYPTGPGTPLPAPAFRALPDEGDYQSRWNMVPGVIYPNPPGQDTSAPAASEQVERGKYTSGELRERLAYSLLDENPGMSRNALMGALRAAKMGCRDDALRAIMARWQTQRRGIPVALPVRGVESNGEADEADEPEERAV